MVSYNNVRRMLSMVYFHCKTIRNAANITANFKKLKSAAKSVILGRKNHKKVQQSPGGTDSLPDKLSISPQTVCCDMILHLGCFSFTLQSIGTVLFWPQNYT